MKMRTLFKMFLATVLFFLLISNSNYISSNNSFAQGPNNADRQMDRKLENQVVRNTVSSFESTDEEFITNTGGHLDQYLFREDVSNGRLIFNIDLDRYYSDHMQFDGNGFLTNYQQLIDKGLLPENATLHLRVWDVDHDSGYDSDGDGLPDPEVDYVYVNNHLVVDSQGLPKKLTSGNETWSTWSADIPIEWLKFPSTKGSSTQSPTAESNEIAIDIDVTETGAWAVEVDWGRLTIEPDLRPTILVHGFGGQIEDGYWDEWYKYPNGQTGFMVDAWIPTKVAQLSPNGGIDSNAAILAGYITDFKKEYGVDEIYIVAHSKGGLDSRSYIRNHNDVEVLVQIGTPNRGALLADYVLGIRTQIGLIPNAIVSLLKDPALTQLSTPYMTWFNRFTGKNFHTKYVVYAGNHDPDRSLTDWCEGACYLPGKDDGVVTVSSAHTFSWFELKEEFTRYNPNKDAKHNSLKENYDLFQIVYNQLKNIDSLDKKNFRVQLYPQTIADTEESEPIEQTTTEVGEIYAGQIITETVDVDQAEGLMLQVMWGEGDVDVVVYTPSGERIDPTVASSREDVEYTDNKDLTGLANVAYSIQSPESGAWVVEIKAVNVGSGKAYFVTGFLKGSDISLEVVSNNSFYHTNDTMTITASLAENGSGLTGGILTSDIEKPDGNIVSSVFSDNGNGTYTAVFDQADLDGYYKFLVNAVGTTSSNVSFNRSSSVHVPVVSGASTIGSNHNEYVLDENGDGLYDTLNININLDIATPGNYRIAGILEDNYGNQIQHISSSDSLLIGSQTLSLAFDGSLIFNNGIDGPYSLKNVVLAKDDGTILPTDSQTLVHTTLAYDHTNFQHQSIALTGNHSDSPEDSDGDGIYDYLNVDLEVAVIQPGYYDLNAQLVDSSGDTIVWATLSNSYLSGVQQIRFQFPGQQIGEHRVDGPYIVQDLSIFKTDNSVSESFGVVHTTQPYQASSFRRHVVYLPLILKSYGGSTSNALSGTVNDSGSSVVGTELLLRYYNGSSWSTYATTTTDASGNYQFTNLPSLSAGQYFYVRWYNTNYDSSRLWTWGCWSITSSTIDPNAYQCDFDLDNVDLLSPSHGATVSLPYTFSWSKRAVTTDDYELNLSDVTDGDPYWYTSPSLGYVSSYNLGGLPTGFSPYQQYGWWMWLYGPDGYGISYYTYYVTFSNSGITMESQETSANVLKENIELIAPPQAK